jgi:3-oxoacyl-[acyl-carrier protein] reductase
MAWARPLGHLNRPTYGDYVGRGCSPATGALPAGNRSSFSRAQPRRRSGILKDRKVVVVTGGASGIGAACVSHFIGQGWHPVVNYYLDSERGAANDLVDAGRSAGQAGLAVQGDVTIDADCRAIAAQALHHFGRIDALICSAGMTRLVAHADLDALTMDDFLSTAAVNTAGPFQISRACAPALADGEGGAIVIISSYGAIFGTGSSIAYAASKGATNTLTMSLARVLAPRVRVNAVCPALVGDGFVQRLDPELFAARAKIQIERAPLRRVAKASEVAADVYWLAAGASLMTGTVIALDCGLHLNGDG